MLQVAATLAIASALLLASEGKRNDVGRQAYESTCARCHGTDGKSMDYLYIKRLDGIGKRLSRDQIRERLRAVRLSGGDWMCRGTVFSSAQLDALVEYLRTL